MSLTQQRFRRPPTSCLERRGRKSSGWAATRRRTWRGGCVGCAFSGETENSDQLVLAEKNKKRFATGLYFFARCLFLQSPPVLLDTTATTATRATGAIPGTEMETKTFYTYVWLARNLSINDLQAYLFCARRLVFSRPPARVPRHDGRQRRFGSFAGAFGGTR